MRPGEAPETFNYSEYVFVYQMKFKYGQKLKINLPFFRKTGVEAVEHSSNAKNVI